MHVEVLWCLLAHTSLQGPLQDRSHALHQSATYVCLEPVSEAMTSLMGQAP